MGSSKIADVCVCALFYGAEDKHFKLAQRFFNDALRELGQCNVEFRFGCNAVGSATENLLNHEIQNHFPRAKVFNSSYNLMKYPMMREMLHQPFIRAPVTMWFDHDSYLDVPATPGAVKQWLARVQKTVTGCNLIGSVQKTKLTPVQLAWCQNKPWFKKELADNYLSYVIGGWWAIRTHLLGELNWPAREFQQKHGDVFLGAMFKHNNLPLCFFRDGVRINVNDAGVEAAAPRSVF